MTREEILKKALQCVNGEREQQYGSPENNFAVIADLWVVYLKNCCVSSNADVFVVADDVAAMMALLKIARISSGVDKVDNWVDLAGYAACGGAIQSNRDEHIQKTINTGAPDEAKKRYERTLKEVEAYCNQRMCSECPVDKNLSYGHCMGRDPKDMTMDELSKMLEVFKADDALRRTAKAKTANMHCRRKLECSRCSLSTTSIDGKDSDLYRLCHDKMFFDMTEEELDRFLARFGVRRGYGGCLRCKHRGSYIGSEPCSVCNDFDKYEFDEEDTDEQS